MENSNIYDIISTMTYDWGQPTVDVSPHKDFSLRGQSVIGIGKDFFLSEDTTIGVSPHTNSLFPRQHVQIVQKQQYQKKHGVMLIVTTIILSLSEEMIQIQ